jgi:hypothetical protein
MHHTSSRSLVLLGVLLRAVYLRIDSSSGVVFLRWTLTASRVFAALRSGSTPNVGVLAKRPLDVLAVGVHIIKHLACHTEPYSTGCELGDIVGALDKLFVDGSIKIGFILQRGVLLLLRFVVCSDELLVRFHKRVIVGGMVRQVI